MSDKKSIVLTPGDIYKMYMSLIKGEYIPHIFWKSKKFRIKYVLRTFLMPVSTYKILKIIISHAQAETLLACQPRLPCRLQRPYLTSKLSRNQGIKAIHYHYKIMTETIGHILFTELMQQKGIAICSVCGKDGQQYFLHLISCHKLDREGEASLILKDSAGDMLSVISFTFYNEGENGALIIGGLQGPNHENAKISIQQATKNLYGIFPKRIIIEALAALARNFRMRKLYAVSNDTHVYQSPRYKNKKQHMHSDYNSFWESVGGTLSNIGYDIPYKINRKSLEEIPSKKRAEYRRKFETLDLINIKIDFFFKNIAIACDIRKPD